MRNCLLQWVLGMPLGFLLDLQNQYLLDFVLGHLWVHHQQLGFYLVWGVYLVSCDFYRLMQVTIYIHLVSNYVQGVVLVCISYIRGTYMTWAHLCLCYIHRESIIFLTSIVLTRYTFPFVSFCNRGIRVSCT